MSSATFVGNADSSVSPGFCPTPPPPPPPPVLGQMPAMRINTVETPMSKRPVIKSNDPYEPPAAIQNAMMTKDKKPFTYTPGMGGKLDLSQIRSPRMARRVAKNANDEGIEGPPKSPLAAEQPRPVNTGANLFIQPQVAVPVFPANVPQINRAPSNVMEKTVEPIRPTVRIEPKLPSQPTTPDTPTTPTQITLAKAPTPWLQNKNKPQEELPDWAKRSTTNGSASSAYSPPESPAVNVQTIYLQQPPSSPQVIQPPAARPVQQRLVQQVKPVQPPSERVIPLRMEDRPSVFSVKNEPGHHQLKQSSPHHQQRWGQSAGSSQSRNSPVNKVTLNPPKIQQSSSPGTYIVPIVVEGSNGRTTTIINNPYQSTGTEQNQVNRNVQRTSINAQQESAGPVQSRSFRVLQKITDTDGDDVDNEQLRKLQLTEDDKLLMNKFKEQVDGDNYLHQEEDPRYRGAAIPSRAFRYLQNMTDSNEIPATPNAAPRAVNSALKRQNRNSRSFEETQSTLPPSEQQVQEPKKYTGSAIPSKSFRILQAMTTPEAVVKQENHQADFTYQVESSMMPQGNQHGVFIPHYSHQPIYWAYCPISQPNNHLHYHPNNNNINMTNITNSFIQCDNQDINASSIANNLMPYTLYPLYNQNFYPITNNTIVQQQQQQQQIHNNSLDQPIKIGLLSNSNDNEIKENWNYSNHSDEINSDKIEVNSNFTNQNNKRELEKNWNRIESGSMKNSEIDSMNITHEETNNQLTKQNDLDILNQSTNDKNISVDCDESNSDETSESSSANNEQINNEINNTNNDNDNSSNSESDSDSYLAYSTGLNPRKNHCDNSTIFNDEPEDKQNTDCESYIEEEEEEKEEEEEEEKEDGEAEKVDNVVVKMRELKGEGPNEIDSMGWKNIPDEINESSSGDATVCNNEETTINIRLPLRLKCRSVPCTDDGTTKTINANNNSKSPDDNINDNLFENTENNDVCVNLRIPNETNTSVNFTLRKKSASIRPKSWCPEAAVDDFSTIKTVIKCDRAISPITFNLCENIIDKEPIVNENNEELTNGNIDMENKAIKDIPRFEVTVEEEDKNVMVNNVKELSSDEGKKNKYLLNVQNSHEETDDEDSGVTSDMSRLISEVDTDSECGPSSKKILAYKRTQTHSRLFKLLNDDLIFTEEIKNTPGKYNRRNCLSLPLKKSNGFNDNCSNYSSGITSSDSSPIYDPPNWKRLHEPTKTEKIDIMNEDKYYNTWKKSKESPINTAPTLSLKLMETKSPLAWPYKSNVLCPRIKSSKNVPKALQNRVKKPPIYLVPSCIKYDRC